MVKKPKDDSRQRAGRKQARKLGWGLWFTRRTRAEATSAPLFNSAASASKQSGSAPHPAGTSRALAQASKFLDTLPTCSFVTMANQRVLDRYLAAIEREGVHKIEENEATEFTQTEKVWQLILLAVSRAESIYGDNPYSPHDTLLTPSGYSKKTTISDDELPNGGHVIVVTVRGSACFGDWLVNLNGAPALAAPDPRTAKHASCETPRAYHQGLLAVAQDMQGDVVGAIANRISGLVEAQKKSVDLLFTGHLAGGAIAKLLYALSASPGSLFANILPKFRHIHCIVFGAPPVATSRIVQPDQPPSFRSGLFLNIVNERDPIALAQQEYIHFLLACFIRAQSSSAASGGLPKVPEAALRLSGTCVVLRDVGTEIQREVWRAVVVAPEVLEQKLFGDVTMHPVVKYAERIKAVHQASLSEFHPS